MTDCSCVYVSLDCGERPAFHSSTKPIARVTHVCNECDAPINPGEQYERSVGCWDGEFTMFKTCPVCLELRGAFFCEGWFYGCLYEDLRQHLQDTGLIPGCLVELSPAARDVVCDMIEEQWED
jgi:hypothetical protein